MDAPLWIGFAFVKCTYRIYSMLLKILPFALLTNPLSVQALHSRSCLYTYVMQLSHLNGRKFDGRQIWASCIYNWLSLTVLLITSRQGPHRKHRSSVAASNFREYACLWNCYSVTAVILLFFSRPLPSNGSTCRNILKLFWGKYPFELLVLR
jgi:hypothetical protein